MTTTNSSSNSNNDGDYEPDLNIEQLHEVHAEREKNKRLVFETIYLRCREKILYANNVKHRMNTWYTIPTVIWGLPLYNVQACVAYLMYRLRLQNFQVQYQSPNRIWIDWTPQERVNYAKIDNTALYYDPQTFEVKKDAIPKHADVNNDDDGPVVLHGLSRLHQAAQRIKYGRKFMPNGKY
jgi:hypothetical protein